MEARKAVLLIVKFNTRTHKSKEYTTIFTEIKQTKITYLSCSSTYIIKSLIQIYYNLTIINGYNKSQRHQVSENDDAS